MITLGPTRFYWPILKFVETIQPQNQCDSQTLETRWKGAWVILLTIKRYSLSKRIISFFSEMESDCVSHIYHIFNCFVFILITVTFPFLCICRRALWRKARSPVVEAAPCLDLQILLFLFVELLCWVECFYVNMQILTSWEIQVVPRVPLCANHLAPGGFLQFTGCFPGVSCLHLVDTDWEMLKPTWKRVKSWL